MKKIVFAALMLLGIAGITQAQTSKKSAVKPASSVTTVTPAKKPAGNSKASTTSTSKVNPANIGKHKKAHHKAAKKPAKKS